MKILLIYPYSIEERVYYEEDIQVPPIGIYYIGAVLKENRYDVEIINWYNKKDPVYMEGIFEEKRPDIIGFSILNANRWGGIEIAQIAKRINPSTKIIFGGPGASFLRKHLL